MTDTQYETSGPGRFKIGDLRGMMPAQMRLARAEFHARATELHEDPEGEVRDKTPDEAREFKHCIQLVDAIDAHLAMDEKVRDQFRKHPKSVEYAGMERRDRDRGYADRGATFRGAGYGQVPPGVAEDRDRAFAVIDEYRSSDVLSARAADRLDEVLRGKDPAGGTARYIAAVGNEHYRSAFSKMLGNPVSGHLQFSPEEVDAVRTMGQVMAEERAMGVTTGSAGQFALPLTIDPSIILTGTGALNPVRDVANVETIGTYIWKGVSSDGVTAGYSAEAAESTDNSPVLVQPVLTPQRGSASVPFSVEVSSDWDAIQSELVRLITDARNVLDATKFLTGSGTNEPSGILNIGALNGLTTTQRVQTLTTAVYAVGDPWLLKAQIPPRFLNSTTFAAAPGIWDLTYRFVAQGSTTEPRQFSDGDRGGDFLGRPKIEWSTMVTTTTTASRIMIGGDFRTGFKIVDRIGMQAEFIQNLVGPNQRPTGQRGLFCWWRTSSGVVALNALRYLEVK
jgi:HK97 family phage major capsid protein